MSRRKWRPWWDRQPGESEAEAIRRIAESARRRVDEHVASQKRKGLADVHPLRPADDEERTLTSGLGADDEKPAR